MELFSPLLVRYSQFPSCLLAIVGVGCRFSIAFIHSSFLLYGVIRYSIIHSLYSFLYENGSIENNKIYTVKAHYTRVIISETARVK